MSRAVPAAVAKVATLRLRVTATAESILRSGHPWLFSDSIREQNREGQPGELAVIYDRKDRFLAVGLYDPDSVIRVRILHVGKPQAIDRDWWRARLDSAIAKRKGLFDGQTTGYRLINGESDGWPGLVLDRYDTTFVVKLYTAAWLSRLDEIAALIGETLHSGRLVVRLSRNIQSAGKSRFGVSEGGWVSGRAGEPAGGDAARTHSSTGPLAFGPSAVVAPVVFLENGLRFEAEVLRGQKTGFFLDQRENRRIVESLAHGREVLNAFSFTGGFSVYAARGGARCVTDLDISEHALMGAKRTFSLNRDTGPVASCEHETIRADAFEWLDRPTTPRFDLVILDPPSLAKQESERAGAIRAYERLAANGIRLLRHGGILAAASCSAHVPAEDFFAAMARAAVRCGRQFLEVKRTGHPPDHPATFSEARYLKCVYLRVS
jgi:23S rRNA (cytosine1962-C5)-methyltransferase